LHSSSVSQPNVISLLSSERNQGSSNNDTTNNQNSKKTSSNCNSGVAWQLDNSASVVSIANTTRVDGGVRERIQIASVSILRAESFIASSKESRYSRNREAVHWGIVTSLDRIAQVGSAILSIGAGDVGVYTTSGHLGVASVDSAIAVVVTISKSEGSVLASLNNIASVVSATVSVITNNSDVSARAGDRVTAISSASISVITIVGSSNTLSIVVVADVVLAENWWANYIQASVAHNRGVLASTKIHVTSISCANVHIVTRNWGILASNIGVASGVLANCVWLQILTVLTHPPALTSQ